MPEDSRIDEVKATLDTIKADDIAEDAAYEQQIADLQLQLASVTAERDSLAGSQAATIADLQAARFALQSQLDLLDARITALGG